MNQPRRLTVSSAFASALALAALVTLTLASGCKRESSASAAPAATGAAATTGAVADPAHVAAVETLDRMAESDESAAASMRSIAGRMQYEAEHRPAGTIKAEGVFAALAKAGVPITDGPRQYVAVVAGAEYCVGGQTADGLGVAVCEYASADKARAGKAAVEKRFAQLNGVRDIVVRGATTLTLTGRPDAPLASSKQLASAAFATL